LIRPIPAWRHSDQAGSAGANFGCGISEKLTGFLAEAID